jgi:hypothetical protein
MKKAGTYAYAGGSKFNVSFVKINMRYAHLDAGNGTRRIHTYSAGRALSRTLVLNSVCPKKAII